MTRTWRGFAAWAGREQHAGDRLPYARLLDERTVLLRDGSLMQCLHLAGAPFETLDGDELDHGRRAREAALRSVAHARYVVHHHIVRRRIEPESSGVFEDPVCELIDRRWREQRSAGALFSNDLFVTVVRRPPKGKVGVFERLAQWVMGGRRIGADSARRSAEMRELDGTCEALLSALQPYVPRVLGEYDTASGRCSEPLELLSLLFNGELRPVLRLDGDAGRYLPYRRISFGLDAIERSGAGANVDRDFAALLSLKEYPPEACPGMLDALLRLPCELVVSESFAFVDRQIGMERIGLAQRRQRAADDDSSSLHRGLAEAKDDLASGRSVLGEHRFSVLVRETSLAALDLAVADCSAVLADLGAVAVREDLGLEPAFWAQFPGNETYAARRALLSSGAFACLASLHAFPTGHVEGNHWGESVTMLESTAATPFAFNFHQGDLGNFTVIGPSGSGKTVVLNFLAAQAQRFAPRTVFFDKDRGSEIFVRAIGGQYAGLRGGETTGFNPLQLSDTPGNRAFLCEWIAHLACRPGERLEIEDQAAISAAIDASYEQAPAMRRLRYLRELLGGRKRPVPGDLSARLAPWCGEGEQAWLFDNAADRLDMATPTLGFDMTELLDAPVLRTPTLMYLFHRIEERLDGCPTIILIDEGWKALDDEVFCARIRDWMKTLRKRNAIIGFGTQSARDALESRVASAVIEQVATQIFMPNPRAQAEDYCGGFGLTAHELGLVRDLPARSHCFLVKQGNRSVLARLDLSAMPDLLTTLSGRESSIRQLDELRRRYGDHPADWFARLTGTPYPGESPRRFQPTLQVAL